MQKSIVYSKIQVVTHHYQRFSCSQYLLLMQVQAQPQYQNALTQIMIPYSHTQVNQFKIRNQMQHSHSERGTQCILLKIKKVFSRLVMGLSVKRERERASIFPQQHELEETFLALLDYFFSFSPHPQLKLLA
ncbi:hypothetical protein H5410_004090 [Solanum commersonii]|uniref:Uncharacterized protein n=1 Tax=Solanum commersonii TaxID=4109 RepID=A0A9J6B6F0_SOLCO|nr:hypothetical protein H5410_004090 [Solanum commersonii]